MGDDERLITERQAILILGAILYSLPGRSVTISASTMVHFDPDAWEVSVTKDRDETRYELTPKSRTALAPT